MSLLDRLMAAARIRRVPVRDTSWYPRVMGILGQQRSTSRALLKPTPANLRYFSRTVYARRAINAIKQPISQLSWEVVPVKGAKGKELERHAEIVTRCLEQPHNGDNFRSFVEQVVEDYLVIGAGVIEQQIGSDEARPLWMWPVDAQSIEIYPDWNGSATKPRYLQTLGYGDYGGEQGRPLLDKEIIYMRCNPSTATPYGYSPIEIAFEAISRKLGVALYAGNLAGNAQPQNLIYPGNLTENQKDAFTAYWRNEIEGQGKTPIIGGETPPQVIRLHAGSDEAMYLKWQDFLIREIAVAFDLSPQNLGLDASVNRATAEVAEDRDWDSAIKPLARNIESHITRQAIQGLLGHSQLRFRFTDLDREDEAATSKIYQTYYTSNLMTPNEMRERLGMSPSDNPWADKLNADVQVAIKAANGAKEDATEPDLTPAGTGE